MPRRRPLAVPVLWREVENRRRHSHPDLGRFQIAALPCPAHISCRRFPSPKEISDMKYVLGMAGQRFEIARGPGENAGADSPPPAKAPAPPAGGGAAFYGLGVQGLPLFKPPYA